MLVQDTFHLQLMLHAFAEIYRVHAESRILQGVLGQASFLQGDTL
jgi:hypothetical protein